MTEEFTGAPGIKSYAEIRHKPDENLAVLFGDIRRGLVGGEVQLDLTGDELKTLLPKVDDWMRSHGKPSLPDVDNLDIEFGKGQDGKTRARVKFGIKRTGLSPSVDMTLVNSAQEGEIEAVDVRAKGKGLGFISVNLDEQARNTVGGTKIGDTLRDFYVLGLGDGYEDTRIKFELTEDERLRIRFTREQTAEAAGVSEEKLPETEIKETEEENVTPGDLRKDAEVFELVHGRHPTKFDNYYLYYLVNGDLKAEMVNPDNGLEPSFGQSMTVTLKKDVKPEDFGKYVLEEVKTSYRGGEIERNIKVVRRNGRVETTETGQFTRAADMEAEASKTAVTDRRPLPDDFTPKPPVPEAEKPEAAAVRGVRVEEVSPEPAAEAESVEPGYVKDYKITRKKDGEILYRHAVWNGEEILVWIIDENGVPETSTRYEVKDPEAARDFFHGTFLEGGDDFEISFTDTLPKPPEETSEPAKTEDQKTQAWNLVLQRQREKVDQKLREQSDDAMSEAWDAYERTGKEVDEAKKELSRLENMNPEAFWNELQKRWVKQLAGFEGLIEAAKKSKYPENVEKAKAIRARLESAGPLGVLGVFPEENKGVAQSSADTPPAENEPPRITADELAQKLYEDRVAAVQKSLNDLPPPEPDSADAWGRENDRLTAELNDLKAKGPGAFLAEARKQSAEKTEEAGNVPRETEAKSADLWEAMKRYRNAADRFDEIQRINITGLNPGGRFATAEENEEMARLENEINSMEELFEERFGVLGNGLYGRAFGDLAAENIDPDTQAREFDDAHHEMVRLKDELVGLGRRYFAGEADDASVRMWYKEASAKVAGYGKAVSIDEDDFLSQFKAGGGGGVGGPGSTADAKVEVMPDEAEGAALPKRDVDPRLRQRANEEVLVDVEHDIAVTLGIPTNEHGALVEVPNKPHVFVADRLRVADPSHPVNTLTFADVNVMLAHGFRQTKEGKDYWAFGDGTDVVDTVRAFNKYAQDNNLPPVEFLIICNPDYEARMTGVRVDEFEGDTASNSTVAYALGSDVHVTGYQEDGEIIMSADSDLDYFNLDELNIHKQIEVVPTEIQPEYERRKLTMLPEEVRPGSTWYEHVRISDPNLGETYNYLFHYRYDPKKPGEKYLVQEIVDETGIVNTNDGKTFEIPVKSKTQARAEVRKILERVKQLAPSGIVERNVPVYGEGQTPEELAHELISELKTGEKPEEKRPERTTDMVYQQFLHVRDNLDEALTELRLAQKKVAEERPVRRTVFGPSLKARAEKYEMFLDKAIEDVQPALMNINTYLERKLFDFKFDPNDPDYVRFQELGAISNIFYDVKPEEKLDQMDSLGRMQKYADAVEERFKILEKLEDRYAVVPVPGEATGPEPAPATEPIDSSAGRPSEPVDVRTRLHMPRALRGRERRPLPPITPLPVPVVQPQADLLKSPAIYAPSVSEQPRQRTPSVQGGWPGAVRTPAKERLESRPAPEGERPQKTPVEFFLDKRPEYRRVVKRNEGGGKVTYTFYNINRNKEGGGLRIFNFTLHEDGKYEQNKPIMVADPGELENELKKRLDAEKSQLNWEGYEYVDFTPELEEKLKSAQPSERPQSRTSALPERREERGRSATDEEPVFRSIEYYLKEKDPAMRRVVKETKLYKGREQVNYSFYRFRKVRRDGKEQLELYSFTLLDKGDAARNRKPKVMNHHTLRGLEVTQDLQSVLRGQLEDIKKRQDWKGYEILDELPPELEEILKNPGNIEVIKPKKKERPPA